MISFLEYTTKNHDGVAPNAMYLLQCKEIIGRFFVYGPSALNAEASDEVCAYCLMIQAAYNRGQ